MSTTIAHDAAPDSASAAAAAPRAVAPFRVIAIPTDVVEAVRATRRSPRYGHPAHAELATGYGPCRHCLRTFEVGVDRRILFTYDAFDGTESLPLPGPVFVHESSCERYAPDAGFPEDVRRHRLTMNAYGRGRRLRAQAYVDDGRVDDALEPLLARADVDYVHVRDTEAGCYDFRIERDSSATPGSTSSSDTPP